MARRLAFLAAAALFVTSVDLVAQTKRPPPPQGNRIPVHDGDVIVVENDARVKIVTRRDAQIRTVYNAAESWLILLIDYATVDGGADGRVDRAFSYSGLSAEWPLGERWEGPAIVESYGMAGEGGPTALGIVSPVGLLQLGSPVARDTFRDPEATAVISFKSGGGGGVGSLTFDDAERRQVAQVRTNIARNNSRQPLTGTISSSVTLSGGSGSVTNESYTTSATPMAPVRVGGNIRPPKNIVDVPAVLPAQAAQAGIRGVVILELTIGADGSVTNARVLRSIPLLDEAALEAARQWRYEPVLLNGKPVPAIMTATVNFQ